MKTVDQPEQPLATVDISVPPGCKRTEAGVIPTDWEVRPLFEVLRPATGQVDPRREPFKSMVLVAPDHIESGTGRLLARVTAEEQRAISGKYVFGPGDIVYSKIRPYLRKAMLSDFGGLCSADMYPLTPAAGVSSGFMHGVLLSYPFTVFVDAASARSGIPKVNREDLAGFRVGIPSTYLEQSAIAEALSDADGLIGALEALIAKKRAIKQAAMQQLLTAKTRLPGFDDAWEDAALGQLGECIIGLTYEPKDVVEDGLLVLRASNIRDGRLVFDDNVYVDKAVHPHLLTRERDVLICVRNGSRRLIGKCAVIDESTAGATFGAFMTVYRTKHSKFIFQAFQADEIQQQIRERLGATINQITNKDLNSFRVKLPSGREQAAITTVLSDMDAEIAALEQRLNKTRAIKQGMMQQLLTGRIRLVEPNRESEAKC
ncbi:MAG: restriction endonuclease subunit S [Planctomycetes bacterium]|nr:restriction endonuclease subunit S [Planctomycetota bacterium]